MFQQQEQSAVCIEYDSDEMGELYRTRAEKKKYKLLLNSDEERFGGWGNEIPAEIMAEKKPYHYKDYSISFDLPPYGAAVFLF